MPISATRQKAEDSKSRRDLRRSLTTANASVASATEAAIFRQRLRHRATVREQVDSILTADSFDPATVAPLATRDDYPAASKFLRELIPGGGRGGALIGAIWEITAPRVELFRIGLATAALVHRQDNRSPPEDLAGLLRDCGLAGRCALAAAGMPVAPWKKLTREERAAVTLRCLIHVRRAAS